MKKFYAVIPLLALTLALTACGKADEQVTKKEETGSEAVLEDRGKDGESSEPASKLASRKRMGGAESGEMSDSGKEIESGKKVASGKEIDSGTKLGSRGKTDSGKKSDSGKKVASGKEIDSGTKLGSGGKLDSGKEIDSGKKLNSGGKSDSGKKVDSGKKSDSGKKTNSGKKCESEYEYVRAALEDDEVTITILSGESASLYLWRDEGLRYDEPYPVSGLTNRYTDVFAGNMGNDVYPYVFLLTEQGQVECIPVGDVLYGWMYSESDTDPVFISSGVMSGTEDVVSFHHGVVTEASGVGYATVFAVTADGDELDLSDLYYYAMNPQDAPPSEEEAMAYLIANDEATDLNHLLNGLGMSMMGEGTAEFLINGEACTQIAAGTNHEEHFVREIRFAVSRSGAIYQYDVADDCWIPSNMLAKIYDERESYYDLFAIICEPNGHELDDITTRGRVHEVNMEDPVFQSKTPMILLPLENDVTFKIERIDVSQSGKILSETVLDEFVLSRGDMGAIYARMPGEPSLLSITAAWKDGPTEFTACWNGPGGGESGDIYMEYVSADGE